MSSVSEDGMSSGPRDHGTEAAAPLQQLRSGVAAALEGAAQGDFVGVFEVPAHRQAGRQPGHGDADGLEHPCQVGGRGLALKVGVGGDDDFLDGAVVEPGEELTDPQLFRARCRRSG